MEQVMNIAVLGTGNVGQTLASKLSARGHRVTMGTRDPAGTRQRTSPGMYGGPSIAEWLSAHPAVDLQTFADAAAGAQLIIVATSGGQTLAALDAAGEDNLNGKVLLDVTNPLDFSRGMPPSLTVCNTDSLGEQIQRRFPGASVVKSLNTVNAGLMVDPGSLGDGQHTLFVSGNDQAAKAEVVALLRDDFGWQHVLDLGDITTARGSEMFLPLWVRLWGALGTPAFNVQIVR
jgi:8-hydroxy-5-deazaflavin:NADPH oxidoreductase